MNPDIPFIICQRPDGCWLFKPPIHTQYINAAIKIYQSWFDKWFVFYKFIRHDGACQDVFIHHILCHYVDLR